MFPNIELNKSSKNNRNGKNKKKLIEKELMVRHEMNIITKSH